MGDRANVHMKQGQVYLYTHWGGCELPLAVREALKRNARWDDDPYLARIIFDEMTGLTGEETGFGISHQMGDNGHLIIEVDTDNQTVSFLTEGQEVRFGPIPFKGYVEMTDAELELAFEK